VHDSRRFREFWEKGRMDGGPTRKGGNSWEAQVTLKTQVARKELDKRGLNPCEEDKL